jgi:hypothetical protein
VSSFDSRLTARASLSTESTRISQTRCGIEVLWVADSDFTLVFVAAQFTLDRHVPTFGEGAGEVSQLPEGDASMPFGSRFPRSGVIRSGRFSRKREHRDIGCVANLALANGQNTRTA